MLVGGEANIHFHFVHNRADLLQKNPHCCQMTFIYQKEHYPSYDHVSNVILCKQKMLQTITTKNVNFCLRARIWLYWHSAFLTTPSNMKFLYETLKPKLREQTYFLPGKLLPI